MKRKRKNKRIHQLPVYSPDNDLLWSHEPESELDVIQTFYQGEAQPNGLTKVQVLQKQTLLHLYNSGTNPVLLRIDICEHEDLDTTTKKCVAIKQHKAL